MNKMFQTDKTCSPFNGATKNMETETMQKTGRVRKAKRVGINLTMFTVLAFMLSGFVFTGCDKDNGNTTKNTTTGNVIIYNKYSRSTHTGISGDIQKILISNDSFFQTYYYDIKKGENKTIANIPEGTYSVEAQVKTISLYRNVKKTGVKVNKGQTVSVTFQ